MDERAIATASVEYAQSRALYEGFAASLAILIEQLCVAQAFDVETIDSRAKTVDSLVLKLKLHPTYTSLDDVADKVGVRVITRYQAAVAPLCDLLHREFNVVEEVTHGGESPSTFGYASRHLLLRLDSRRERLPEYAAYGGVTAELQVRSILQHAWALISHSLDYKSGIEIPQQVRRRLFRVAAILETGDEIFDTFVTEVATLRSGYVQEARGNWRALAIDLDSAEAVASHFPWSRLEEAAVAAGWGPPAEGWDFTATALGEPERAALGQLVQAAAASDITTWEQLARIAESIDTLDNELREIAAEHEQPPFAIGPWVIVFLLADDETARRVRAVAGVDPEAADNAVNVDSQDPL